MDHTLELIIPYPLIFKTSSYPEILDILFFYFLLSWKYWKLKSPTFSIILEIRAAGGRLQGLGSGGLDYFWNMFLEFPEILEIVKTRFYVVLFFLFSTILEILEIEVSIIPRILEILEI